MAKSEVQTFWNGLFTLGIYKRSQGRLARQLTAVAIGLVVVAGAYILSQGPLNGFGNGVKIGIPAAIVAVSGWLIFRLVNYPVFAEFLISVEGEMNKVSWASKQEIYRATVVVLGTMVSLAVVLYVCDFFWLTLLSMIGVLQGG
ncbi:MAG: preprotein translocase subunit SecE [Planctomycetales bacterium]